VALSALTRAARSIPLYQPGSASVRQLLTDCRDRMREALEFGPMDLLVRPFELVMDGEVVYIERDRERSLSFRLFRDGVRRLVLASDLPFSETAALVEILLERFSPLAHQEEDFVSLFWKAGFGSVRMVAVEGFVEDDQDESAALSGVGGPGGQTAAAEVPRDWDQPLPALGDAWRPEWRPIPAKYLAAACREVEPPATPALALRLVRRLLEVVANPADPTSMADIAGLLGELRDWYLSDGRLDLAADLLKLVQDARRHGRAHSDEVIAGYGHARTARAVLRRAQPDDAPEALRQQLEVFPGDHFVNLLDISTDPAEEVTRVFALRMVATYARDRYEELAERLPEAPPQVIPAFVEALVAARPDSRIELASTLVPRPEGEIVDTLVTVLSKARPQPVDRERLLEMTRTASQEVRLRAAGLLADLRDPAAFPRLIEHIETGARGGLEPHEAAAFGRAAGRSDPEAATRVMVEWIRPRNLLKRLFELPRNEILHYAAVSGLAAISAQEHEGLIRWLQKRAGSDLQDHCSRVLTMAKRGQGG
jgi:hypothetical protein